jgi:hypothetical protein
MRHTTWMCGSYVSRGAMGLSVTAVILLLFTAPVTAKNCDPEPTDMLISYLDQSIQCSLREAVGDQDLFRFDANANDIIRVVAAESEFDTNRDICLEIRDPSNNIVYPPTAPPKCGLSVLAELTLPQSGRYTIIVSTGNNGQTTYALTLLCLLGQCSGSGLGVTVVPKGCNPCHPGNFAKFNVAVSNSHGGRTVEMKVVIRLPDGNTTFSIVDRHHEAVLAAGSTVEFDIPGGTVPPGLPEGNYSVEAALLDPNTGKTLARHAVAVGLGP